jgi:membrane-associated protease RseP (regulator of RpoE activity)
MSAGRADYVQAMNREIRQLKKCILKIICISWIAVVCGMVVLMFAGAIPPERGETVLLLLVMPVMTGIVVWGMERQSEDDDKDDSDVFLSPAYRDMPCNIYYEEYERKTEFKTND